MRSHCDHCAMGKVCPKKMLFVKNYDLEENFVNVRVSLPCQPSSTLLGHNYSGLSCNRLEEWKAEMALEHLKVKGEDLRDLMGKEEGPCLQQEALAVLHLHPNGDLAWTISGNLFCFVFSVLIGLCHFITWQQRRLNSLRLDAGSDLTWFDDFLIGKV
eukprot:4495289-Amphidinium_carterae.1